MKKLLSLAAFSIFAATGAMAATIGTPTLTACEDVAPDVSGNVTPTVGCYITDAGANLDEDFTTSGGTEFTFVEKDDGAFGGGTELVLNGDSKSGTWSITNWMEGTLYALVFKDGQNALPDSQVIYATTSASGDYSSPFYNDLLGDTQKDISFTALFTVEAGDDCCGQIDVDPIPLPAGIVLLGSGIAAFGVWGRKNKRKA